jgi:hypothetical protein
MNRRGSLSGAASEEMMLKLLEEDGWRIVEQEIPRPVL